MKNEFSEKLILKNRTGAVLFQNTILKFDDIPIERLAGNETPNSFVLPISGAKNFRKIEDFNIYGTSQPRSHALDAIFNLTSDSKTTFINLREEPSRIMIFLKNSVIYINSRPFVLRDYERPHKNLDYYQGIDNIRIESMEKRLKSEILLEAKKYNGNIVIHEENVKGEVEAYWESVNEVTVQTPKDLFNESASKYKNIEYYRIPITPGKSFSIETFDDLFELLRNLKQDDNVIFNCQFGRTRSTMAMIICCLIKSQHLSKEYEFERIYKEKDGISTFLKGEYRCIQNLTLLLYHGKKSKHAVDFAIDRCSAIFNLRESIFYNLDKWSKSTTEEKQLHLHRYFKHLHFYSLLIVFSEYLGLYSELNEKMSFSSWLKYVPEVNSLLNKILNVDERITSTIVDVIDFNLENSSLVNQRNGILLSKNTILKVDHFIDQLNCFPYQIDGCPNFRKINSDITLYSCSTPNKISIDKMFKNFKKSKVVFINLRQEPHIYINGEVYCLRTIQSPFQNIHFSGVKRSKIEKLEQSLKSDVQAESKSMTQKLLVHDESERKDLVERWVNVKEIQTSQEFFSNMQQQGFEIDYKRVPMSSFKEPTFHDIDRLLQLLLEIDFINAEVVFFDQRGLSRCTLAMVIGALFEKNRYSKEQYELLSPISSPYSDNYLKSRAITSMTRTLPFANTIVHDLENILDASSFGNTSLDLRKDFIGSMKSFESSRSNAESEIFLKMAATKMKKYCILVLIAGYLIDQSSKKFTITFSNWIDQCDEIIKLFSDINQQPEYFCSHPNITDDTTDKVNIILENRKGNVLAKRNILKADHFPFCQRKSLLPHIQGAPNYRKLENVKGHIYGVAIPSLIGIKSILNHINAKKNQVYWISLREEPVCYIQGVPFVLRDCDNPYSNLIQTGISSKRLEAMEDRLKDDILQEAKEYKNKCLVHDEEISSSLVAEWKEVTDQSVFTPRQVFEQLEKEGYKIKYFRVPVTDERAPEPKDFDDLLDILKDIDIENSHLIFNCQGGRGRTTTGCIIASLINNMRSNYKTALNHSESIEPSHLNGNFKLISKLMRVLENAKENKLEVDSIIDISSQMQNLRTSILEFKLLGEKNKKELERSGYYLERYFLLIVFNEFLMEQLKEDIKNRELFSEWLTKREEILNLLSNFDLE